MHILAIESSCDETAASVVEFEDAELSSSEVPVSRTASETRTDRVAESEKIIHSRKINILSNVIASQIELHKPFGGVFPEHASRAHAEKIIEVIEKALKKSTEVIKVIKSTNNLITSYSLLSSIDLIAVTSGPGLIGSLLVGLNAAKTLAYAFNKPIIGINHWLGHIYSNWAAPSHPSFPALILIVSGGHTGLVLMKSHTDIETLGQTVDDAAGEAFDKVAKLLNLDYPGGPAISRAAEKYQASLEVKSGSQAPQEGACDAPVERTSFDDKRAIDIHLPRPMLNSKDYNFSFSGLKTAVLNEVRQIEKLTADNKNAMAAEFQQAVIDVLVAKTIRAAYEFKPKSICLCGGVSANKELREQMKKAVDKLPWTCSYHVPPMILSTDNAAMIGIAAAYQDKSKWTTYDKVNANSNLKL